MLLVLAKEILEWCLVAEDIIVLAHKIIYTYFLVSESIYVEKGVWGKTPPPNTHTHTHREANNIWKYQIKWNHFHHMGPEYFFHYLGHIIFITRLEPFYFFLAYQ